MTLGEQHLTSAGAGSIKREWSAGRLGCGREAVSATSGRLASNPDRRPAPGMNPAGSLCPSSGFRIPGDDRRWMFSSSVAWVATRIIHSVPRRRGGQLQSVTPFPGRLRAERLCVAGRWRVRRSRAARNSRFWCLSYAGLLLHRSHCLRCSGRLADSCPWPGAATGNGPDPPVSR